MFLIRRLTSKRTLFTSVRRYCITVLLEKATYVRENIY